MSTTCSAEDRALQVEKEIWKEIDAGRIKLRRGVYQRQGSTGVCEACAVGSAARAICGLSEAAGPARMRSALADKGAMSVAESFIMEQGFESGLPMTANWFADNGPWLRANYRVEREDFPADAMSVDNPFFQLGLRLSDGRRPEGV